MREVGTVERLENNFAVVKVDKKDECSKCGMCLFPQGANSIEFVADNKIGAQKGDKVIIEKGENGKLQGALLVFLVPLLLIGLSVILGLYVIKWELSVLILSGTLIILWYIILSIIDKKLKYLSSFKSVIVEIVKEQ